MAIRPAPVQKKLPVPQLYPLTAFEEYMLIDDTVDHPMTFFLRVRLVGQVQPAELRAAFSDVVRKHPMFWSTIDHSRRGPSWSVDASRLPMMDVKRNRAIGDCPPPTYIDLQTEPGIRASLSIGGDFSDLWLQFHHSCSDGIGSVNFLRQLLDTYGARMANNDSKEHEEAARFPTNRCAYDELTQRERFGRLVPDLARVGSFLRNENIALEHCGDNRVRQTTPSFMEIHLPFEKAMLQPAGQKQTLAPTVNDVLLRDTYLAVGDWVRRCQVTRPSDVIRILAPINMRRRTVDGTDIHNNVSLVFLDRRLRELGDTSDLLHGISREMSHIKRAKMGHAFLRTIRVCRRLPQPLVTKIRNMRSAFATVVVSNLGCMQRLGVAKSMKACGLTGNLLFLTPIRSGTPVSFGVLTHADKLTVGMQYDDAVLDRASAEQLLGFVRTRMTESLTGYQQPSPWRRKVA